MTVLAGVMARLDERGVSEIGRDELEALLAAGRPVREVDTRLAGALRVLEVDGRVVVQEQTTRGQLLARLVPSLAAADALVADRLAVYERMWDGCGCRVDYFA